ncbi:MAG TPA: hypothetical protein VKE74_05050 [Gemmataceae bacterium]|nr:hypothetical protein [Gemmataceae bacterium]
MIRLILLMPALLLLTGCGRKHENPNSLVAVEIPALKVDLDEKVGQPVEVTGRLVGVSVEGTKEQGVWVGEYTATLSCKRMTRGWVTVDCKLPRATKAPDWFRPGRVDGLLTVRGTVVSVGPGDKATLADCVVVGYRDLP